MFTSEDPLAITMTGIDARTDLSVLPDCVEFGVLFTATPDGRNRYPQRKEVERILCNLSGRKTSLHVCGKAAREALRLGLLNDLTSRVQRLQVNGSVKPHELEEICDHHHHHAVITQHTKSNGWLLNLDVENHAVLVDGSGGRGISPWSWIRPATSKSVGFAGGLGPDNIVAELTRIRDVAAGEWWIDMEGKLRDHDDWFDVRKACDLVSCL